MKKKSKRVLSLEEHAAAEEQRARPFKVEIVDVGNDCVSIKSPIIVPKERLELLQKICDITDEQLRWYIEKALFEKVQIDLENPSQFGQVVCETLLKQWGTKK